MTVGYFQAYHLKPQCFRGIKAGKPLFTTKHVCATTSISWNSNILFFADYVDDIGTGITVQVSHISSDLFKLFYQARPHFHLLSHVSRPESLTALLGLQCKGRHYSVRFQAVLKSYFSSHILQQAFLLTSCFYQLLEGLPLEASGNCFCYHGL